MDHGSGTVKDIHSASQHKSQHGWKNFKNLKDCHRNDTEDMARTKAIVRRLPVKTRRLPTWMVNRGHSTQKRTVYPFKIKETLPQQWTPNITKNEETIKTINVRRKSRYFTGENRLIF